MTANHNAFQAAILQGIPTSLPPKHQFPAGVNRAPKRKDILSKEEKYLAIRNALRYFPKVLSTSVLIRSTKGAGERRGEAGGVCFCNLRPEGAGAALA